MNSRPHCNEGDDCARWEGSLPIVSPKDSETSTHSFFLLA